MTKIKRLALRSTKGFEKAAQQNMAIVETAALGSYIAHAESIDATYAPAAHSSGVPYAANGGVGGFAEHVGTGRHVSVYRHQTEVGGVAVGVLKPRPLEASRDAIYEMKLIALRKGLGANALQQLVAADPDKGVIVTRFEEGVPLRQVPTEVLKQKAEQGRLDGSISAIATELSRRGLGVDVGGDNVLLNGDNLSVIDYHPALQPYQNKRSDIVDQLRDNVLAHVYGRANSLSTSSS